MPRIRPPEDRTMPTQAASRLVRTGRIDRRVVGGRLIERVDDVLHAPRKSVQRRLRPVPGRGPLVALACVADRHVRVEIEPGADDRVPRGDWARQARTSSSQDNLRCRIREAASVAVSWQACMAVSSRWRVSRRPCPGGMQRRCQGADAGSNIAFCPKDVQSARRSLPEDWKRE